MHDKKLYGTATVGTKGQVVIPADAREALDLQPGERLYAVGSTSKQVIAFIKEDRFRQFVDEMTDDAALFRSALNTDNTHEE